MLHIAPRHLTAMSQYARHCFPEEACGLLTGQAAICDANRAWHVEDFHPARNIATTPRTRFEVDPALRLRLQRQCRGTGTDVIGVFHSHPNGSLTPSETDLAMAFELDLIWIIMAGAQRSGDNHPYPWSAYYLEAAPKRFVPLTLANGTV